MFDDDDYISINCNMWNSVINDETYIFPELSDNLINEKKYNPNGVGLAFSGGGTTAYTSGIGYLRGLRKIAIGNSNAYDLTQFISSISGGSWVTGTYLFAQRDTTVTDDKLLGEYIEPNDITYETLNNINFTENDHDNTFLGARIINFDVISMILEGITNGIAI